MKIKYQWFLGGRVMFWVSIILFIFMLFAFATAYIIDPVKSLYMKEQSVDPTSIQELSEKYVACLGVCVDMPIEYRFVKYNNRDEDVVLLGTFHEWNGTYRINISVDLYKTARLSETVIHETRHMIVEYLRDKNIIDLTKYTEEIAQGQNEYYNSLFNSGVYLLKKYQSEE